MSHAETIASLVNERLGPSTVDDVRAIRAQLDEESGHDLHRLAEMARKAGAEFRQRTQASEATPGEPSTV
jgi:hypothetical protein